MERNDKLRELKTEMLRTLVRMGGTAWETPRMSNGAPTIHFVWDGQYYGFYPVIKHCGTMNLNPKERWMLEQLSKAGATVAAVSSVVKMEEAMGLDARRREIRRLLPLNKLEEMLRKWGRGESTDPDFEAAILGLQPNQVQLIYALYFDRMTLNQYADESNIDIRAAHMRKVRATFALRERLVKKFGIVGDHVIQ